MREPFINEVAALSEIAQLTKERDDLREAVQECFNMAHDVHDDYLRAYIHERTERALANLNKPASGE